MIADKTEITVGWDCEFKPPKGDVLVPLEHRLYIYDTATPILIDCSESGQKTKSSMKYMKTS